MLHALVIDRDGNPIPGLNRGDFETIVGDRVKPVAGVRMATAETETRRFVFVLNRRGALPAHRVWYRLTVVGETEAGERESQVLQVRVPGCSGRTVLPAPSSLPE